MTTPAAASSRWVSRALTVLVVLVLVLLATKELVAEPMRIRTMSMSPTLVAGDHVLADKVSRRDGGGKRGDVGAFRRTPHREVLGQRVFGPAGGTARGGGSPHGRGAGRGR